MNRATRQIVGCFIGNRNAAGASLLWQSLPTPCLDAVCHTDGLSASTGVVFGALHVIGGTQRLERFNATLRLRIAHLVRKSLSLSRKQEHLELLIWLFIHRDNAS
ncbi:IS1 family transposase [Deinococcus sp. QL22]|uniref:IS1 family transposase n=1 Tax=Deinococcus sp. QL22 TaxID=2939437 RepID=UPI002017D51A|nr:IS1 family transposase [Deinococcus sp. QL22]UQN09003.1 IS1 family transposase [Deinococcus sp. QL22]